MGKKPEGACTSSNFQWWRQWWPSKEWQTTHTYWKRPTTAGPGLKHAPGGRPRPMLSRIYWPALWLQAHPCFWQALLCVEKDTEISSQGIEKSHRLETVCPCVRLYCPAQLKDSSHTMPGTLLKGFTHQGIYNIVLYIGGQDNINQLTQIILMLYFNWTQEAEFYYDAMQILKRVICRNYGKARMTTGSLLFLLNFLQIFCSSKCKRQAGVGEGEEHGIKERASKIESSRYHGAQSRSCSQN